MARASEKNTDRLKRRVVLLAAVAVSALALITTFVVSTYDDLLNAIDVLSKPKSEVSLFNKLLTDLSLAENSLRAYTLTQYKSDYVLFDSAIQHIEADIDSLVIAKSHQVQGMDSIGILLKTQVQGLKDFVKQSNYRPYTFTEEAISRLGSQSTDSIFSSIYTQIRSTTKSETDSVILLPSLSDEKKVKGIFNKLKLLLSKDREVQADTLKKIATTSITINDTTQWVKNDSVVLSMMQSILQDARNEEKRLFMLQKRSELAFLEENNEMIDKIRTIIKRLEQQEIELSSERRAEAKFLVDDSLQIVTGMILFLAVVSIIILVLIFADISKSNFYKTRLERAKVKAEKLAKVKQQFLANMSHEIRTPLTAIVGYSNLLTERKNVTTRNVQILKSASKHLLSIVNDILDISKIESTGLTLKRVNFNLQELLKESCDTFQFAAYEKKIKISYVPPHSSPIFVEADHVRLKQVLYNLIDNAIKFTSEGEVKLKLKTIEIGSKIECYIEVSDTGIGISEDQLHNIFTDFYQSDTGQSKAYKGTGLGLAIAKKLVALHGGDINVRSTLSSGSTFSVFLPLHKGKEDILESESAEQRPELTGIPVLVIDDDPFNLELLNEILTSQNMQPDLAESAKEAFHKLETDHYDVIITDIHMPEVDGIGIIKHVKKIYPDINVIALTADVTTSFSEYGFSSTIIKPIEPKQLFNALVQSVSGSRGYNISAFNKYPDALYDLADIHMFAAHDPNAIKAILEAFVETVNSDIELMKQHLNDNNWAALSERAHKMIAPCAQLKVNRLVEVLKKLEAQNWGNVLELEIMIEEMSNFIDTLLELLRKEIAELIQEVKV